MLYFSGTGSILVYRTRNYGLTTELSVVLPAEHAPVLICQIQLQQVCLLPINNKRKDFRDSKIIEKN